MRWRRRTVCFLMGPRGLLAEPRVPTRRAMSEKRDVAVRVSQLLLDPVGRGRATPGGASRRDLNDPMMFSHAAFVPGIGVAVSRGMYDLAGLQSLLLVLSMLYHQNCEKASLLARVEGSVAKTFFVYGVAQIANSPPDLDPALYGLEVGCAAATVGTFLATNLWPSLYEAWHPLGLHVVPGLWSLLVALNHFPLLMPALSNLFS